MAQVKNQELQNFVDKITDEMSFGEARTSVHREVLSHLEEQVESAMILGVSHNEAVAESLRRMGNPVEIGRDLNTIHQPKIDFVLPGAALGLSLLRFWNLSASPWNTVQILWIVLGLTLMTILYFVPIKKLYNSLAALYLVAALALIVAHLSGVQHEGQPYLSLGIVRLKIVDLAGYLFAMGLAAFTVRLTSHPRRKEILISLFLLPMIYFGLNGFVWPGILFLTAGTGLMLSLRMSKLGFGLVMLTGAGLLASRFIDALVTSAQLNQAILNNAETDYVIHSMAASITAEVVAGLLFLLLVIYGGSITSKLKDKGLRILACTGMLLLGVQIVMSLLANFGLFPMIADGINVPFISYGGSAMLANYVLVGVLLACHKRTSLSLVS